MGRHILLLLSVRSLMNFTVCIAAFSSCAISCVATLLLQIFLKLGKQSQVEIHVSIRVIFKQKEEQKEKQCGYKYKSYNIFRHYLISSNISPPNRY
jgi:ABC-type polar amino acid transport system ATPase subunit